MFKEKSFLLVVLVLLSQVVGLFLLRKRYTLVNKHKPITLTEEEKMLVFMDVAQEMGLQ